MRQSCDGRWDEREIYHEGTIRCSFDDDSWWMMICKFKVLSHSKLASKLAKKNWHCTSVWSTKWRCEKWETFLCFFEFRKIKNFTVRTSDFFFDVKNNKALCVDGNFRALFLLRISDSRKFLTRDRFDLRKGRWCVSSRRERKRERKVTALLRRNYKKLERKRASSVSFYKTFSKTRLS